MVSKRRREALERMARAAESPNEAAIARRKLEDLAPETPYRIPVTPNPLTAGPGWDLSDPERPTYTMPTGMRFQFTVRAREQLLSFLEDDDDD